MSQALLLFTKVPEPGYVKTRLTEGEHGLSAEDACRLYSAVLLDVFDLVSGVAKSAAAKLYVAYTPPERGAEIRRLFSNSSVPVSFFAQEGRTTAERITHAFEAAFADGQDAAVMIFGDQPGLHKELFVEAFHSLRLAVEQNRAHLVLGPTCDGGTYLIGLTSGLRSWISNSIDCTNTSKAVSRLLVRAVNSHAPYTLLEELIDLDDPVDLELLMRKTLAGSARTAGVLSSLMMERRPGYGPDLSAIIPTLNEESKLERTIQSLRAQQPPPKEIVVVDCGSQDRTLEIANAMADRVIVVNRCGRQYQENVGARGAKGDILFFLHADTLASPTLLRNVARAMKDRGTVGGGARLRYYPCRMRYRALSVLRDAVSKTLGIFGMGSSFFVRHDAFHDAGGFDEYTNEEGVDMSKRLRKYGKLVMLDDFVQTSARRYESCGFIRTLSAWAFTVALTYFGVRAGWIERHIWRVVR